ncbi:adenylosuccinate synthase [Candidatus Gottesmanbacteria bacterium]|nr:adenylosuccinate synthase [Candidatus Gottesmanbacteria bacterium]
MNVPTVVIGAQWGDEGKGKLVDSIGSNFDIVGRFNGGNNAGHTVIYKGEECKLHVLPSGIFQKKKLIISQGAVFDPEVLLSELEFCNKHNIFPDLMIDYRVNLVMPYHKLMDAANELWKGSYATGSVKVGIGYCYEDRNNRSGIRCEDLLYPEILKEKLENIFPLKRAILEKVYRVKVDLTIDKIYERFLHHAKVLTPYINDVSSFVSNNLHKKTMLFEGAMATMLDGQFGTYPYTVANNTIASSIFSSLGIPNCPINVIGVVKAYTTRVGGGPFPTEQNNKSGKTLQIVGHEIAATSGRIRRCGWLDLPILRFANKLNKFSSLAITKLDVLSKFSKIPVCIGYRLGKKTIYEYPAISHEFYRCKPIYQTFTGWNEDISRVRRKEDLPKNCLIYLRAIEKMVGIPIRYISVGPDRKSLIYAKN